MNNQNPPHAELKLVVEKHFIGTPSTAIKANINGCRDCLQAAITALLLHDQDFKELINKSIRKANEIKARTQN